ncbi:hypothetical protein KAU33_15615 [Candidatus Dependentiae bacterium]|nr:hypothetical protein [Candidatus Dependentiae bacterium]
MGLRHEIVDKTVTHFASIKEMNPSTTDIRLISNEVGESFVEDGMLTIGQWEQISQDKTVELVRAGLRKSQLSLERMAVLRERGYHEERELRESDPRLLLRRQRPAAWE